jgi:hypothetical protein
MSFEEHAVTAPAGEVAGCLVKINHTTWATPLRYALDTRDWIIPGDGTYVSTGASADGPGTDDTGVDSRAITIPDLDFVLWKRLEKLSRTGSTSPVIVTVSVYLSTDLTTPVLGPTELRMASPTRSGRIVQFEASTVDVVNRDAPTNRFTWANAPGLRR